MAAAENDATDHGPGPGAAGADPPVTVDLIADLQAGLLDDEVAARVRRQVRADPEAADVLSALNQVRRDVAAVGRVSAPDAPPQVTARISAALAGEPAGGAHSARPGARPLRTIAAAAGFCAVLAAVGFGTGALWAGGGVRGGVGGGGGVRRRASPPPPPPPPRVPPPTTSRCRRRRSSR